MYLVVFMVSTICDGSWLYGAVLPVHMYLVVFMVSVMVLYYLYICIYGVHGYVMVLSPVHMYLVVFMVSLMVL